MTKEELASLTPQEREERDRDLQALKGALHDGTAPASAAPTDSGPSATSTSAAEQRPPEAIPGPSPSPASAEREKPRKTEAQEEKPLGVGAKAQPPKDVDWEHRWKSAEGRIRTSSTELRLERERREAADRRNSELQKELGAAKAARETTAAPEATRTTDTRGKEQESVADFSVDLDKLPLSDQARLILEDQPELGALVRTAIESAVGRVARSVRSQFDELHRAQQEIATTREWRDRIEFLTDLEARRPGFSELDKTPDWAEFVKGHVFGIPRTEILKRAVEARDYGPVLDCVDAFMGSRESGKAGPPGASEPSSAPPGNVTRPALSSAPTEKTKQTYTYNQWKDLLSDAEQRVLHAKTDDELRRAEADSEELEAALSDGRVK